MNDLTEEQARNLTNIIGPAVRAVHPGFAFILVMTDGQSIDIISNAKPMEHVPDILREAGEYAAKQAPKVYHRQ